jgi:tetratricopeptide (TPR) repeat protein
MADWTVTDFLKRGFKIREPLLISILVLIAVVFSALTHAYNDAYARRRAALAVQWFDRGNQELNSNRPQIAIDDFRTALFYDPRNFAFSMHLANALTLANHTDEAQNYYVNLWQRDPANGLVNLELGRLYAKKGMAPEAERYFNGAIFGTWPKDAPANRRAASLELIGFYLDRGDVGHAESQLIILSANLPEDPVLHTRVGELYSRVGNDRRALAQYREAIRLNPAYLPAIEGAGRAAFRLGDYRTAETYLNAALHIDQSEVQARDLLNAIQSIFTLNPYERGLSESEKSQRTLRAFDVAGSRLTACASPSEASSVAPFLDKWKQLKPSANLRFLTQHPEQRDILFDFAASAEKAAQNICGQPSPNDSALLTVAKQREAEY